MKFSKLLFSAIFTLVTLATFAQRIPQRPNPPRLVNDFASILTAAQEAVLERKLVAFSDSTTNQIAVVTIGDLDGSSISSYASKLFDSWGIGTKGRDNGVLILVKPPREGTRGEVFIAVGYGLEGAIPDVVAGRIVDYELIPAFRNNNYYLGIEQASETLMRLAAGEFSAKDYISKTGRRGRGGLLFPILVILLFILSTRARKRHSSTVITSSGSGSVPPIFIGGFPFMPMGGRGYSSGDFGGFDGFSGGGGGFGGFGGGFTGGGGAGGSW